MAGTGYRGFYMAVRVRDETSRGFQTISRGLQNLGDEGVSFGDKMAGVGSGLMSVGTATASLGVAGAAALGNFTTQALEFGRQTAYAFTQVDELGTSVEQIREISKSVAEAVPVPIEQINEGLYDLFSTIDVSVGESEELIMQLAKATIAGQTDMSTATRGTIAIMNAFKIPAEDMSEVLDFQFQLVRKGAGTYQDFATTLGLSLPAFAAADQHVDTLGGTLSFLTRNGLSASRASTSAARAMEMLVKPDVIERLQEMGIEVTKADGSFQDLGYIITQLADGPFKDLQGPEYVEMFKSIFGQGSIQGRRFYDLVLKNTDEYNERLDEFQDKAGAMEGAYDIMFNEGAIQSELLRNQFDLLRIELGTLLIPTFMTLLEKGFELIQWFKDMDPELKESIVKWTAISSAVMIAGGALFFFMGAAVLFNVVLARFIPIATRFLGPLAAVAAIAYLIYKHWDTIGPVVMKVVKIIQRWAVKIFNKFLEITQAIYKWTLKTWPKVWHWIKKISMLIAGGFMTAVNAMITAWDASYEAVSKVIGILWEVIQVLGAPLVEVFHIVADNLSVTWRLLGDLWDRFAAIGRAIYDVVIAPIYNFIEAIVTSQVVIDLVKNAIGVYIDILLILGETLLSIGGHLVDFAMDMWKPTWDFIVTVATEIWDHMWTVIQSVIEIALSAINLVIAIFTGDWGQAWQEIQDIFGAVWDVIVSALDTAWALMSATLGFIGEGIKNIASTIWDVVGDVGSAALGVGTALIEGLWNGVAIAAAFLWQKSSQLMSWILLMFYDIGSWFLGVGADIIDHIWSAIKLAAENFVNFWKDLGKTIGGWIVDGIKEGVADGLDWLMDKAGWFTNPVGKLGETLFGARGITSGMASYQNGGIINGPQNALIGEAGAEAVVPLSRPGDAMAVLQNSGLDMSSMGGGGGITINIYGNVDDADQFAEKVANAIGEEMFANGY